SKDFVELLLFGAVNICPLKLSELQAFHVAIGLSRQPVERIINFVPIYELILFNFKFLIGAWKPFDIEIRPDFVSGHQAQRGPMLHADIQQRFLGAIRDIAAWDQFVAPRHAPVESAGGVVSRHPDLWHFAQAKVGRNYVHRGKRTWTYEDKFTAA